jgi:hypothetical protein
MRLSRSVSAFSAYFMPTVVTEYYIAIKTLFTFTWITIMGNDICFLATLTAFHVSA